ncbi:MAG: hypothetical protein KF774_20410 [Planctomyces sp.]|nr:hypothetical protein [Planctomyces sp.]
MLKVPAACEQSQAAGALHTARERSAFAAFAVAWAAAMSAAPLAAADPPVREAAPMAVARTASEFRKRLEQPLVVRVEDVELGPLLRGVARGRGIVLHLDRRVDTSRIVNWDARGLPLLDSLNAQLSREHLAARSVGATIVVGPRPAIDRLRTVVAQRTDDLRDGPGLTATRRAEFLQPRAWNWEEAASPSAVLERWARDRRLTIEGLDEVAYDVWDAGELAAMSFIEALSVVLFQFDQTFEWTAAGGIRVVPLPESASVERKLTAASGRDDVLALAREAAPAADIELNGRQLVVRGLVEEIEAIERMLNPGRAAPVAPATPLKDRRFTLTARQVTVREALATLVEQGLEIDYDPEALETAGFDLDRRFDLRVQRATAAELFRAICSPVQLTFEIDGSTVRIPAPTK